MYGFGKYGLFNPQKVCSGRNGLQAAGLLRCDGRRWKATEGTVLGWTQHRTGVLESGLNVFSPAVLGN